MSDADLQPMLDAIAKGDENFKKRLAAEIHYLKGDIAVKQEQNDIALVEYKIFQNYLDTVKGIADNTLIEMYCLAAGNKVEIFLKQKDIENASIELENFKITIVQLGKKSKFAKYNNKNKIDEFIKKVKSLQLECDQLENEYKRGDQKQNIFSDFMIRDRLFHETREPTTKRINKNRNSNHRNNDLDNIKADHKLIEDLDYIYGMIFDKHENACIINNDQGGDLLCTVLLILYKCSLSKLEDGKNLITFTNESNVVRALYIDMKNTILIKNNRKGEKKVKYVDSKGVSRELLIGVVTKGADDSSSKEDIGINPAIYLVLKFIFDHQITLIKKGNLVSHKRLHELLNKYTIRQLSKCAQYEIIRTTYKEYLDSIEVGAIALNKSQTDRIAKGIRLQLIKGDTCGSCIDVRIALTKVKLQDGKYFRADKWSEDILLDNSAVYNLDEGFGELLYGSLEKADTVPGTKVNAIPGLIIKAFWEYQKRLKEKESS